MVPIFANQHPRTRIRRPREPEPRRNVVPFRSRAALVVAARVPRPQQSRRPTRKHSRSPVGKRVATDPYAIELMIRVRRLCVPRQSIVQRQGVTYFPAILRVYVVLPGYCINKPAGLLVVAVRNT